MFPGLEIFTRTEPIEGKLDEAIARAKMNDHINLAHYNRKITRLSRNINQLCTNHPALEEILKNNTYHLSPEIIRKFDKAMAIYHRHVNDGICPRDRAETQHQSLKALIEKWDMTIKHLTKGYEKANQVIKTFKTNRKILEKVQVDMEDLAKLCLRKAAILEMAHRHK